MEKKRRKGSQEREQRWKQASITVEAAYIVPLVFLLGICMILLVFFVHDKVWFTCAAYESALTGNAMQSTGQITGEAAAQQKARERAGAGPFPGTIPDTEVKWDQSRTEVTFSRPFFIRTFAAMMSLPDLNTTVRVDAVHPEDSVILQWCIKH